MIYKTLDRSSMTGQQGIQMHQHLPVNKCTCKVALENSTDFNRSVTLHFLNLNSANKTSSHSLNISWSYKPCNLNFIGLCYVLRCVPGGTGFMWCMDDFWNTSTMWNRCFRAVSQHTAYKLQFMYDHMYTRYLLPNL